MSASGTGTALAVERPAAVTVLIVDDEDAMARLLGIGKTTLYRKLKEYDAESRSHSG